MITLRELSELLAHLDAEAEKYCIDDKVDNTPHLTKEVQETNEFLKHYGLVMYRQYGNYIIARRKV